MAPSQKTRILLAILASAALLLGCTGANAAPTPAPATPTPAPTFAPAPRPTATPETGAEPTPAPTAIPSPQLAGVSIRGFAFNPGAIDVKVGTTVTWTNDDSVAHTVASDSGGIFGSPAMPPGGTFSFTFTAPGAYPYHCAFHPSMHGTVTVTR
ncbi:MAG: cupredoxin family copper-binding protein [Candidatus ainarchaeum sp.]|nr:cupredoxin family copper-binding protein [Candidatus ainarchaeum sp.]